MYIYILNVRELVERQKSYRIFVNENNYDNVKDDKDQSVFNINQSSMH